MKRRTAFGATISAFLLAGIVTACGGGGSSGGGSSAVPAAPGANNAPAAPGASAAPGSTAAPGATTAPGASPAPTGVGAATPTPAPPGATPPPAIPVSTASPTTLQETITVGTMAFPGVGPSDTAGAAGSAPLDGLNCDATMGSAYHQHTHLSIFNGTTQMIVPMAIGMFQPQPDAAGDYTSSATCFYWLHVHDHSGILHEEDPNATPPAGTFTLKNVFDEWGQPLSRTQIGPLSGSVRIYVTDINAGTAPVDFTGDPNTLQLNPHNEVSIFVNPVYGPGGNSIPRYTWTF